MTLVMPRNIQDQDEAHTLSKAAVPAKDWVKLFFARSNPHAEFEAANAMAQSAARTLQVSVALAETGRAIDLGGLENWIGRLTASILDLDPDDGRRMRPALTDLLRNLDTLEHVVLASLKTSNT